MLPQPTANAPETEEAKSLPVELSTHKLKEFPDVALPLPETEGCDMSVDPPSVDVLLVVVTEVELDAVLRKMKPLRECTKIVCVTVGQPAFVGVVGKYRTAVICSAMGSYGPNGSHQTVPQALSFWKPKASIMVGIAFGLHPNKQALGDVLVCNRLKNYEAVREQDAGAVSRASIPSPSPQLVEAFNFIATKTWPGERHGFKIHRGLLLTGSALVDSREFSKGLLLQEPEAIGGDMEGDGFASSAQSKSVPWIIVKSICDFGGLDKSKSKEAQPTAAATAMALVHHMLSQSTLVKLGCAPEGSEPRSATPSSIGFSPSSTPSPSLSPSPQAAAFSPFAVAPDQQRYVGPSVAAPFSHQQFTAHQINVHQGSGSQTNFGGIFANVSISSVSQELLSLREIASQLDPLYCRFTGSELFPVALSRVQDGKETGTYQGLDKDDWSRVVRQANPVHNSVNNLELTLPNMRAQWRQIANCFQNPRSGAEQIRRVLSMFYTRDSLLERFPCVSQFLNEQTQ